MDSRDRNKITKIIRDLHDQMGGAIPVDDVVEQAEPHGFNKDQVEDAIKDLMNDGMVTKIDEDTIEFM